MCVDSAVLLSTRQRQNDLRDQIHYEFVNRLFQFKKRSELFLRAQDEMLFVAMRVNKSEPLLVPNRRNASP